MGRAPRRARDRHGRGGPGRGRGVASDGGWSHECMGARDRPGKAGRRCVEFGGPRSRPLPEPPSPRPQLRPGCPPARPPPPARPVGRSAVCDDGGERGDSVAARGHLQTARHCHRASCGLFHALPPSPPPFFFLFFFFLLIVFCRLPRATNPTPARMRSSFATAPTAVRGRGAHHPPFLSAGGGGGDPVLVLFCSFDVLRILLFFFFLLAAPARSLPPRRPSCPCHLLRLCPPERGGLGVAGAVDGGESGRRSSPSCFAPRTTTPPWGRPSSPRYPHRRQVRSICGRTEPLLFFFSFFALLVCLSACSPRPPTHHWSHQGHGRERHSPPPPPSPFFVARPRGLIPQTPFPTPSFSLIHTHPPTPPSRQKRF